MRFILFLFCFLFFQTNNAFTLKNNYPKRYVVENGDSLWSISSRYLKKPWEWQALWQANPKIQNPAFLYPGAILTLDYFENIPYIKVVPNGMIKLSPHVRPIRTNHAIPPISLIDIKPFLNQSLILDEDVLSHAPYVVGYVGEHLLGSSGVEIYVKGLHPSPQLPPEGNIAYSIYRSGNNYIDPTSGQLLGYKAQLVGTGYLTKGGEPATVFLTKINSGVKKQDRVLINNSPELDLYFTPSTPDTHVTGFIIEIAEDLPMENSQSAVGGIAVINIGANAGLKAGDVLGIFKKRRLVANPKNRLLSILLPKERIGEMMVFRTFTKTSFALIVRSIRPVYLNDIVTNP